MLPRRSRSRRERGRVRAARYRVDKSNSRQSCREDPYP